MKKTLLLAAILGCLSITVNALEDKMCFLADEGKKDQNNTLFCLQTDNAELKEEGPVKIDKNLIVFYHTVARFANGSKPDKIEVYAEYINIHDCKTFESRTFPYLFVKDGKVILNVPYQERAKGVMDAPKKVLDRKVVGGKIGAEACKIAVDPKPYKPIEKSNVQKPSVSI